MKSSPSERPDKAAHEAGGRSGDLPHDYDEYRERMDRQAEAFFDWRSVVEDSKSIREFLATLASWKRLPVSVILIALLSLAAGISVAAFLISRSWRQVPVCGGILYSVFFAAGLTYVVFLLLVRARRFLGFLRDPYPWKVALSCFLPLTAAAIAVASADYLTGVSLDSVMEGLLPLGALLAVVSLVIGVCAAAFLERLRRKSALLLASIAVIIGLLVSAVSFHIAIVILYDHPLREGLPQVLGSAEWFHALPVLGLVVFVSVPVFCLEWVLYSYVPRVGRFVKGLWSIRGTILRNVLPRPPKPGAVLSDRLKIDRRYLLVWQLLLLFGTLAIPASLWPIQSYPLALLNLLFGVIPLLLLGLVTLNYVFVGRELERVRIEAPDYFSRPVLRAMLVLGLLFATWWVYHALLMLNLNSLLTAWGTTGFEFSDQRPCSPRIVWQSVKKG